MTYQFKTNKGGRVDGKEALPVLKNLQAAHPDWNMKALALEVGMSVNQVRGIFQRHDRDYVPASSNAVKTYTTYPLSLRKWGAVTGRVHTCQYIEGDICNDENKCGAEVLAGSSYCPEHHMRCYRKVGKDDEV